MNAFHIIPWRDFLKFDQIRLINYTSSWCCLSYPIEEFLSLAENRPITEDLANPASYSSDKGAPNSSNRADSSLDRIR